MVKKIKRFWTVYILECSDKSFYTGITNDLCKRINTHNAGKGAKYTKVRRPVTLEAFREGLTRQEAMRWERYIKKQKKVNKLACLCGLECLKEK